jgi:hypothetical protein
METSIHRFGLFLLHYLIVCLTIPCFHLMVRTKIFDPTHDDSAGDPTETLQPRVPFTKTLGTSLPPPPMRTAQIPTPPISTQDTIVIMSSTPPGQPSMIISSASAPSPGPPTLQPGVPFSEVGPPAVPVTPMIAPPITTQGDVSTSGDGPGSSSGLGSPVEPSGSSPPEEPSTQGTGGTSGGSDGGDGESGRSGGDSTEGSSSSGSTTGRVSRCPASEALATPAKSLHFPPDCPTGQSGYETRSASSQPNRGESDSNYPPVAPSEDSFSIFPSSSQSSSPLSPLVGASTSHSKSELRIIISVSVVGGCTLLLITAAALVVRRKYRRKNLERAQRRRKERREAQNLHQ